MSRQGWPEFADIVTGFNTMHRLRIVLSFSKTMKIVCDPWEKEWLLVNGSLEDGRFKNLVGNAPLSNIAPFLKKS